MMKEQRPEWKYAVVIENKDKNSSADEIANVNFYAVRPGGTRIG